MSNEKVNISELSYDEIMQLYDKYGSERKAAKALGIPRTTLQDRKKKAFEDRYKSQRMDDATIYKATDEVQYLILSSAQDGTRIHASFLDNLEAYADFLSAELLISGFTYNKSLFEDHSKEGGTFHSRIVPYLVENRVVIGDHWAFCAEMNILPTAVNPLSGLQTYTGTMSGIVPHVKVNLESIPTQKGEHAKMMLTTGAVTVENYVQKKAGQKAEHYHEIGAVIVELLPDGRAFARHIIADDDGSFYDLTNFVSGGEVDQDSHNVLAVTWGDIHREKKDETINAACWDVDATPTCGVMIDALRPDYSFVHDIIDFMPRNHHNISDPHFRYQMFINGTDSVEESLQDAAEFLVGIQRKGTKTVVVESNHDLALLKWLRTADYRYDPANARYFLELQLAVYKAMESNDSDFQVLSWAMRQKADLSDIQFLHEDESFIIANGIECGMHGHLGGDGSKGGIKVYVKAGRRSNSAHIHRATIWGGAYTAGVSGSLEMGYNKGLSSWSHSHIITYKNGKRAIVTQFADGLWCAGASWDF